MSGDKITNPQLDAATLSDRTQEIEKQNEIQSPEQRAGASLADATYDEYFQQKYFSQFSFMYEFVSIATSTGVLKVYATWQDDGTAAASCTYVDVSTEVLGAASVAATAAATVSGFGSDSDQKLKGAVYVKIEFVVTGGASDISYTYDKNTRA